MQFSEKEFEGLLRSGDMEAVAHEICDRADDAFYRLGVGAVPEPFRTVVVVETFWGEITNGGLSQYFTNDHGAFASLAPDALDRVGLPLCAGVIRSALSFFPREVVGSQSPDFADAYDRLFRGRADDPFTDVEALFWDWYFAGNEETIRSRLHEWIVKEKKEFTKKPQPGATDNPDDAQRLREDR